MKQYKKDFTGAPKALIKLEPGGWIFPKIYLKHEKKFYNFKVNLIETLVISSSTVYDVSGESWWGLSSTV